MLISNLKVLVFTVTLWLQRNMTSEETRMSRQKQKARGGNLENPPKIKVLKSRRESKTKWGEIRNRNGNKKYHMLETKVARSLEKCIPKSQGDS